MAEAPYNSTGSRETSVQVAQGCGVARSLALSVLPGVCTLLIVTVVVIVRPSGVAVCVFFVLILLVGDTVFTKVLLARSAPVNPCLRSSSCLLEMLRVEGDAAQ